MSSKFQILNPLEEGRWKGWLESHRESGFFHTAEWARVLAGTYGHRPVYLVSVKDDRLCGLLSVMEVASALTGRRGVSLPFTDSCAALVSDEAGVEDLWREALRFGEGRRWKYFEARGVNPGNPVEGAPSGHPLPSLTFCGHQLDLTVGKESLFGSLAGEVRTAIRKAERAGVAVEVSRSQAAMRVYYDLHCQTRRRHGLPPQSYKFFANIARHVLAAGLGDVVLARHEAKPIAGAVFFHYGQQAVYKYGASDKTSQHLRGNNLVMWKAIQKFAEEGYSSLDFGRSAVADEGLRRFKRAFGGREYGLEYLKYDFAAGDFVQARDRVKGWYNKVFRWMPSALARLAGALLYRHLS